MATVTASDLPVEVLDVARPELWGGTTDFSILLAHFARMRDAGPVHYCPESIWGPYWNIVSHQHIMEVEGQADIFSSDITNGGITIGQKNEALFEQLDIQPEERLPSFISMDEPRHTEHRRVVSPLFSPTEVARQGESIRMRTEELLDSLPVGEKFNWVDKVSVPLTTAMLAILWDFPWEDRFLLPKWSDAGSDIEFVLDPERRRERQQALREMTDYFRRLFDQRRRKGVTHDLVSMLAHSEATNNLSPAEFTGTVALLIVGGNDTTRNTMSGAVMVQNLYPDNWARMMTEPKRIRNGVQELLRWQSAVAHMRRTPVRDVEVGGKLIPKDSAVILWYPSGNRDESVFPNAEVFDPERNNARRHVAFGFGIHRCVGYRLAELQLNMLLEEMQKRQMRVELVGDVERNSGCFINGYTSLPVVLSRN